MLAEGNEVENQKVSEPKISIKMKNNSQTWQI